MKMTKLSISRKMGWAALIMGSVLALISVVSASAPGWDLVAHSGDISLWVDSATGNCKVTDRRGLNEWSSQIEAGSKQNDFWATTYRSAFVIRYLSTDGVKTIYSGQTDCKKTITKTPSGARCRFSFSQPRISLTVDYLLVPGDGLKVNIPLRLIDDPGKGLLDVRVLPYFGNLSQNSRGYVVLPDGCGGVIDSGHLKSITYFGSRVYNDRFFWTVERDRNNPYGSNQRYINFFDYSDPNMIGINLPIFGSVKNKSGILCVIAQGAEQAQIGPEITPDDYFLNVSARLIIRELTYDMFTRPYASPIFNRSDRTMIYYFLADQDASYAGMARRYRDMLFQEQEPKKSINTSYRLRLLFGVERQYKDTRELLTMTTFHQAEHILEQLHRDGLRDLQVVLTGWSKRGYLGDEPAHFPPDPRFGGWLGLKRLVRTATRLGYRLGLQVDNTNAWKSSWSFRRSETVKDVQNIAVELGEKTDEYLRCPEPAWKRFFKEDYPKVQSLHLNGSLLIAGPEQGLLTCLDDAHPLGTSGEIAILREAARRIRRQHPVAVLGAMGYLIPEVDSVWDLPSSCSSICDRPVPLTPMIIHGFVGYSFEPINLRQDNRRDFLRMIEYGAIPNAYLTQGSVEDLADARYNLLFSGRFIDWRHSVLSENAEYQKRLEVLQHLRIENHMRLSPGVYITRYVGGIEVVVNYTGKPFTYKGREVKPENYRIY